MQREVLRLYRSALRVSGQFKKDHIRDKLRLLLFHVLKPCKLLCALSCRHVCREFVEVYRDVKEPEKIEELLTAGKKNVETLRKLSEWDLDTWNAILKP